MACERGPTCSLTVTSHAVIELPHPVCRSDAGGPMMPRPSWADSLREEDRQINDKPTYTYEPTSGQGEVETNRGGPGAVSHSGSSQSGGQVSVNGCGTKVYHSPVCR